MSQGKFGWETQVTGTKGPQGTVATSAGMAREVSEGNRPMWLGESGKLSNGFRKDRKHSKLAMLKEKGKPCTGLSTPEEKFGWETQVTGTEGSQAAVATLAGTAQGGF